MFSSVGYWAIAIMFRCPRCGYVQDEDDSTFYPPMRKNVTMKCNNCNHISVHPFKENLGDEKNVRHI
jgi:rubredoxin